MPEVENTNIRVALPGGRKLYVLACVLYLLATANAIRNLEPVVSPLYRDHSIWHWTSWFDIGVALWCIYFFFETFASITNRMEEVICVLTIIWFALGIPESLHRMGYGWVQVPGGKWIDLVVVTVAALLVFLRTFQVFTRRTAASR